MQIIPVIDLKQGRVVHARMGDRDSYAPIRSGLCEGSEPLSIVAGLIRLYPFEALYVADLDAIAGTGGHDPVLETLRRRFPALRLWVDRGVASLEEARAWLARGLGDLVLGSESLDDPALPERLARTEPSRIVLSLDFRGEDFQGPRELLQRTDLWPTRVIVMTLSRVGSGSGPDFARVADIRGRAGAVTDVYAAGGVRDMDDLRELASRRAAGALVATALHDGRIGAGDIAALHRAAAG